MDENAIKQLAENTKVELKKIYNLPAMSSVMMEVSRLLDDPSTTTADLSAMIGKDQGISTKVLIIANSPLYGLPRKVSTIDFAIMIIGFHDIKNIVVALSMIEAFKDKDSEYMCQKDFWLHSLLTGNAAKRIAEDLGYKNGPEAFVGGLLHDLGIPVISKYFKEKFGEIVERVKSQDISFGESEQISLGLKHSELGYYLADNWNLPVHLCDMILHHHEPDKSIDNEVLAAIVHLADYLTQKFAMGNFYFDERFELNENIISILRFNNREELENYIEGYSDLFKQEIKSMSL